MAAQQTERDWVFDTRELVRRPGTMRELSREVTTTEPLGTDVIAIPAGHPVRLELRMESVVEGILATGTAQATARGECVRCLDEIVDDVEVTFQELYAYPDRAAHHQEVGSRSGDQDASDEDEQRMLDGDLMDLEEVVRDAVVTELPFQPVCREDCPGLCSECGARLADDPEHEHDVIDPRWSALAAMATPADDDEKRT
ncbi:metal-binding protein [Serinicoccus sp. CNJ-927]|uniref:YceD family protein n=1 Tax=Serinicoccus TaxID=265976 RepID=UPI00095D78C1|nr:MULTISPECIES: YceD family protein [Serinicoccus]OLT17114.1 metal-binding protein [Serinicoccus sp. CUA-874]OLT41059.1 metal-binding protein [Serinicoccus sp. CNJ-927]